MNIPVGPKFAPLNSIKRKLSLTSVSIGPPRVKRDHFEAKHRKYFNDLNKLGVEAGATIINPLDSLCPLPETQCLIRVVDGSPINKDSSHLTASFVREKVTYLDQAITLKTTQSKKT